jgi:hypothetical protein
MYFLSLSIINQNDARGVTRGCTGSGVHYITPDPKDPEDTVKKKKERGDYEYYLRGAIIHVGGPGGGHYWCYTDNPEYMKWVGEKEVWEREYGKQVPFAKQAPLPWVRREDTESQPCGDSKFSEEAFGYRPEGFFLCICVI